MTRTRPLTCRLGAALLAAVTAADGSPPAAPTTAPSVDISVIALGGDPTGVADSTAALRAAIAAVAERGRSAGGVWPAADGAGGATLDLGGGVYRVSAPLVLQGAGLRDFTIAHGTLVADAAAFPADGFLLDVTATTGLALVDLTLDAAHAGGGARLTDTFQTVVTRTSFYHYRSVGLWGVGGHELLVDGGFFAEYEFGEPGYNVSALKSGIGVWLDMPDSSVYNSVVRCSRVGVVVRGGGNLLHGVHVYATCSKDGGPGGADTAVALVADGFMARVHGCYWDNSPLVVTAMYHATLIGNVFYGLAGLVYAPQLPGIPARSLVATGNVFTSTPDGAPGIHYDTTSGSVNGSALAGVVVADNAFDDEAGARTTRPAVTVAAGGNASSGWLGAVDLRPHLLFPPLEAAAGEGGAALPWHDGIAYVNALLAARGEPLLGTRRPQTASAAAPRRGPALGDAFGGAFQRYTGAVSILAGAGSPEAFGLWGLQPTATPGVVSAFVTLGSDGTFGNWSALLHLQFDQALATGVVAATVAAAGPAPAVFAGPGLRRRRRAAAG